MQTNPPILSSVPDKLKSDCINQLDQLLTVVKSSELTAVDLLPKRASAARERRASAARSRAAAVARVKRAAAARQQAAARATARKRHYAQQAAAAARKASIAKAKAAAVVVANRAAAARRQAVAVAAAAAATAAANKRRKEQEDANKKLAIQAAIKQAEKAEQTRIAQVAAVIKRTAAASRSVIETHITRSEASAGSSFSQPDLRKTSYQVASVVAATTSPDHTNKFGYGYHLQGVAIRNAIATPEERAKTKAANALTSHVNDNDGIDLNQLNKGQIYILSRPLDFTEQVGSASVYGPDLHASTLYFDKDDDEWVTLAGYNSSGKLVGEFDNQTDNPENPGMIIKAIVDTNGVPTQAYLQALIKVGQNYDHQLDYFAVPKLTPEVDYNSNGYTNGIHKKLGGKFMSFDGENVQTLPGFSNAIPL